MVLPTQVLFLNNNSKAMKQSAFLILLFLSVFGVRAQENPEFLGGGNSEGISVSSSSEYHSDEWNRTASAQSTISGKGLEGKLIPASRNAFPSSAYATPI